MERPADVCKKGHSVKASIWLTAIATISPLGTVGVAHANSNSDSFRNVVPVQSAPSVLSKDEKKQYQDIFTALKAKRWDDASKMIDKMSGPLASMARAELYTAPGSPAVSAEQLQALLNAAPYLPQADQLQTMARKRGANALPDMPGIRRMGYTGSAPKRDLPRKLEGSALRNQIQAFIKADDPASAESLLSSRADGLSSEELTELRYRVAWSYYLENDDLSAKRLAETARNSGGYWGVQGQWTYALANWRLKDFGAAFDAFERVSRETSDDDLRAAALFWSSRAAIATKRPQLVQTRLQTAAQLPETFYGLLASEALGMEPIARKAARTQKLDWDALKSAENVRIAVGMAEIGESDLADEAIRYQAKIGDAKQHGDLAQLAGSLNLPATQYFMGHYGPSKQDATAMARYPMPSWTPTGGWRVDPSLVFAHALQESGFKSDARSGADARGLMQVRPGTAQDMARDRGTSVSASDLYRPTVNLEYGQSYLEKLRDMNATSGLLPKVIAAYNAGPAPVTRWNSEVKDGGDPLLFIESIPYWETRQYVSVILRNYWIYDMRMGKASNSMHGLAQYLWPTFPDENGHVKLVHGTGFANRIAVR